jgi:surface polysaccharide O-acyltransferase-like enzyme
MFLCFALGIANIFHLHYIIIFSVICLLVPLFIRHSPNYHVLMRFRVYAPIILFIEVPLLLRICPTSSKFDSFIRRFTTNYMRAGIYLVMSIIQWISISVYATSLIAAAVILLFAAIFYGLAGLKGQDFVGSKTLGGQGVAQMIV